MVELILMTKMPPTFLESTSFITLALKHKTKSCTMWFNLLIIKPSDLYRLHSFISNLTDSQQLQLNKILQKEEEIEMNR